MSRFARSASHVRRGPDSSPASRPESSELPQLRLATCDRWRRYLHLVRFDVEPHAVADADEVVGLAPALWARESGFEKITMNLVGL